VALVLRYAARSDRGLIRGNNQDSVYAGPRLLAVADGMGGHAAGDIASKVVIAALAPLDDDAPSGDMLQALREAVFDGSEHLREYIRERPQVEGMGTTLTAILFAGGRLALCHVGDSRAYLLRDGQLSQITHDDTFVQTLIDDGRITPEEANHHPQRSLLLRALNGQDVEPALTMREARAGDRYLLCSDGLSGVVSEETLAHALEDPDPQSTADRLIELALRGGGPDNITVIVADVVDDYGRGGALDEPVVDGAAGDGIGQRQIDPRSAAGRAALADPPPPPPPTLTPPSGGGAAARRRPLRILVVAVLVLALVIGGGIGTYAWALQHWFVGVTDSADGEMVGVYRGVNTSIVGLDLYRLDEKTPLAVQDLNALARSRVERGITADDSADADRILDELRGLQLPLCPVSETPPADGGSTTPSRSEAPPEPTATSDRSAARSSGRSAESRTSASSTSASPTTTSASPTAEHVPGEDCREAD
jgi:serine/threonine protein phosphatase PrpC